MYTRYLVCLALSASLPAFAQQTEIVSDIEPGGVRQINATQAHLRDFQPKEETRRRSLGPALARLAGKMLSAHVKGLDLQLNNDPEPAALGVREQPSAIRFNRRAELVYDNYRVGIKRGGLVMRYETSF
jgi:hypothetical protein